MKYLWRSVLFLLLLITAALSTIIMTTAGSQWALRQTDTQLDALSITGSSGRFYDGVSLQQLRYADTNIELEIIDLQSVWRPACLLDRTVCLHSLHAASVSVTQLLEPDATGVDSAQQPFSLPELPVNIAITQAEIKDFRWTAGGETQSLQNIAVALHTDASAIHIDRAALRWQDNDIQLSGALELRAGYPLNANLQLDMPTLLGPTPSALSLTVNGLLEDELALSAQLQGSQQAELSGTISPLKNPVQLRLSLLASLLQAPDLEQPPSFVLQNLQLDVAGDLDALAMELNTSAAAETLPELELHARAQLQKLTALESTHIVANTLNGEITLDGDIDWKDQLTWHVDGTLDSLDLRAHWPELQSTVSGKFKSEGQQIGDNFISPKTTAQLYGNLQDRPFRADLAISVDDQQLLKLTELELHSGENHLSARGTVDEQLAINAKLDAPQLDTLWPGLAGSIKGDFLASGERLSPTITAKISGSKLQYNEFGINALSLDAAVVDGANIPSSFALIADGIEAQGITAASVEATAQGTLQSHSIAVTANTQAQRMNATLRGGLQGADWLGSVEKASLAHEQLQLDLAQPTALAWANAPAALSVEPHCWRQKSASLCLQNKATISAKEGKASMRLEDFDLADLSPWLPEHLSLNGQLQTALSGEWSAQNDATFALQSSTQKLSIEATDPTGQPLRVNFDTAELEASLDQSQSNLRLNVHSAEQGSTAIVTSMDPVTKALTGTLRIQDFLLAPLRTMAPMLDELAGVITAEGDISGTLESPQFTGKIQLRDPALAGAEIPLTVSGGKLTLDIDGREATLNASFFTEPKGSLRISGDLSYKDALRAKLALDGEDLAVILVPTVDATLNHSLIVSIAPKSTQLRGTIHIPDAVISLEGMSGGGPAVSKDLVLTDAEDQEAQQAANGGAVNADIDLRVRVDDDVRLTGYGLDTRLQGDIKVRQRPGQPPQLAGELTLKDGTYVAYGQDLEVRRGELLFVGPLRATRVDVSAVRTVGEIEAGLMLEGSIMAPETSLFSEPAMAEADILSYIVLGGPPGQGGDETAMLARAALGLGLKNSNRIAGQFASAAGIEDFNIGADGKGDDTAVVLSGRLSPKLLLSYRMGVFDTVNTLTARYDLSQALYLELVRGVDQAIDILYTVDY